MATTKKQPAEPAETSPSGYWHVTVNRVVPDIFDDVYRPGVTYLVTPVVIDALGDAVQTKEPVDSVTKRPGWKPSPPSALPEE